MGKLWRNTFVKKSSSFLDIERSFFGVLLNVFGGGCQNSTPRIQRTFWVEVVCFWKFYIYFHLLRTLSEKFAAFCQEISDGHVKTAFFVYIGIISRSQNFQKTVFSFPSGQWAKTFWPLFIKKIWRGWQNSILRAPRNILKENIFGRNICIFLTFSDEIVAFCRNFFGWVVKTASYVSRGKFRRKFFFCFFGYWEIKCMPFVDKCLRDCQNYILVFQGNVLMIFFKKVFFGFFWHSVVSFWPFFEKFSAELSKLLSTCQWKI